MRYTFDRCGCGDMGIVFEMTDRLWSEFFSGPDVERPATVAGCGLCRIDWQRFAGPLVPVLRPTEWERRYAERVTS